MKIAAYKTMGLNAQP